jgi:site-specific DNA-cytosine methylase
MLTHVDLFSGPGGFSTGLKAAGIQTLAAVECDAAAAATHRLNHPEVPVYEADVRHLCGADLLRHAPGGPFREVGCCSAGIPCQVFSHAGNRSRAPFNDRQGTRPRGLPEPSRGRAGCLAVRRAPASSSMDTPRLTRQHPVAPVSRADQHEAGNCARRLRGTPGLDRGRRVRGIRERQRGFDDNREAVWYSALRLLAHKRPQVVVVENVAGFAENHGGAALRFVRRCLRALGYGTTWTVLDATEFGGAQVRRRVFVVASRNKRFDFGRLERRTPGRTQSGNSVHVPTVEALARQIRTQLF